MLIVSNISKILRWPFLFVLTFSASATEPTPLAQGAITAEWPRLLGPTDNASSPETHLLHNLPKTGLPILWESPKGNGFGGPAIANQHLVIFYRVEEQEVIDCLHPSTGKRLWKYAYNAPYLPRYGGSRGPRTSPVIADGRVFTFGISGHLHCLDLATGKVLWDRDGEKDFAMGKSFFGHGSTPLVLGKKLLVQVGGKIDGQSVNSVALNTDNGQLLWKAVHPWGASYSSPIPAKLHGRDCILVLAGGESRPPIGGLLVIDAHTGQILAEAPHRATIPESVSASSPVVLQSSDKKAALVFVSESYGAGGACFSIAKDFSVTTAWKAPEFGLYWMTPLVKEPFLFGFAGQNERLAELIGIDSLTGKELWRTDLGGGFGRASFLNVDQSILCLGEFGDLAWLELSKDGAKIKSRTKLFNAPETWTLPAISRGLLYVSQNEPGEGGTQPRIVCYDFRGK